MRVRLAFLSEYKEALKTLGVEAGDEFRRVMDEWHASNPDATVADARDFCIVAAANVSERFAGPSSEIAAQLFDEVCEGEGIDATASLLEDLVNMDMVEGAARYNAGKLVDGDWEGFVEAEARTVDNNVHRAAYETMKKSCKDNNVQWARIPSGRETCGYCFMLASRGFVYVSEDTAKAGSHVGCDCIVVPGKLGRTEIEGYHPEELYERWKECEDAAESKNYRDVIEEVKTRDWDWLWTGEEPEVDYSDKPRESLEEHEKRGIDALQRNGFRVKTIAEDPKAAANFDIEIDGVAWEMKNVTNLTSSISNKIKRARVKWMKLDDPSGMRAVFTTYGCAQPVEEVIESLRKRKRDGESVLVVSQEGFVRRI